MKIIFFLFSLIFIIGSKTQAQQKYQLTANNDNAIISLTNMSDVNALSGKSYLKVNALPDKNEEFYLRRSKNYRIVGWSTLGAGLVASGAGLLLATNSSNDFYNNSNDDAAATLFLFGAVSGITSIPFMIMATSYKHKARAMASSQKTGFGVPSNVSKDIIGMTFSISLGK